MNVSFIRTYHTTFSSSLNVFSDSLTKIRSKTIKYSMIHVVDEQVIPKVLLSVPECKKQPVTLPRYPDSPPWRHAAPVVYLIHSLL